ncbi:hypothetical protein [Terracidiphilus sp.]|jgi:hypothetical protein|uniref:hypothetical protein n=1 Tax=Terracidiphilus sp. TaxID=1964191 RepID=UPI003C24F422
MATPQNPAISLKPAVASVDESLSRAGILHLVAIVAAGAIGGFLFWVIAKVTGTSPLPGIAGFWTIPALMFLGAFAAAIGVYVLTASDTSAIKTYVFASLCGLCWQPVIASGVRMVGNLNATSQSEQVGSQTQLVQQADASGNVQQLTSAVQQTTPLVTQALNATVNIDTDTRNQVVNNSRQAINQIQSAAAKAPEASVESLQSITVAAANSGSSAVALQGVQSLHALGGTPNHAAAPYARRSLSYVALHAKDPSIQLAARNAATQISQSNP